MAGRQELYKITFAKIFKDSETVKNSKILGGREGIAAEEAHKREEPRDFTNGVISFEIYRLYGEDPISKKSV